MLYRFFGISRFFEILYIGWKDLDIDDIRHRNIMTIQIILSVPLFQVFINSFFSDFYNFEFNPNIKSLYDLTFILLLLPFNYIYFIIIEWTKTLTTTGIILFLRLLIELLIRIKDEQYSRNIVSEKYTRELQEPELKEQEENMTLEISKVDIEKIEKDQKSNSLKNIEYIKENEEENMTLEISKTEKIEKEQTSSMLENIENIENIFVEIAVSSDKNVTKDRLTQLGLELLPESRSWLSHNKFDGNLVYGRDLDGFKIWVGIKYNSFIYFHKEKRETNYDNRKKIFNKFVSLLHQIKDCKGGYFKTVTEDMVERMYLFNSKKQLCFRADVGSNFANFQISTNSNSYQNQIQHVEEVEKNIEYKQIIIAHETITNGKCPFCGVKVKVDMESQPGNDYLYCPSCEGYLLQCFVCKTFSVTDSLDERCPKCLSEPITRNRIYLKFYERKDNYSKKFDDYWNARKKLNLYNY